jgi:hypothetical protein
MGESLQNRVQNLVFELNFEPPATAGQNLTQVASAFRSLNRPRAKIDGGIDNDVTVGFNRIRSDSDEYMVGDTHIANRKSSTWSCSPAWL